MKPGGFGVRDVGSLFPRRRRRIAATAASAHPSGAAKPGASVRRIGQGVHRRVVEVGLPSAGLSQAAGPTARSGRKAGLFERDRSVHVESRRQEATGCVWARVVIQSPFSTNTHGHFRRRTLGTRRCPSCRSYGPHLARPRRKPARQVNRPRRFRQHVSVFMMRSPGCYGNVITGC